MKKSAVRVLLVFPDQDLTSGLEGIFKNIRDVDFLFDCIPTFDDALSVLSANRHDICLLDSPLGEQCGIPLLRKARDSGCEIPVVYLVSAGGGGKPGTDRFMTGSNGRVEHVG